MNRLIVVAGFVALLAGGRAHAIADCAGFGDVSGSSIFCQNVVYLKNRSITLGCGPSAYCPDQPVTRLAMAAFLNRLGTVAQPFYLHQSQVATMATATTSTLCKTAAYAIVGYNRMAVSDASFSMAATAAGIFSGQLIFSRDNGVTWTVMSDHRMNTSLAAGKSAAGASTSVQVTFFPGETAVFALRGFTNATAEGTVTCELRARLDNAPDPLPF